MNRPVKTARVAFAVLLLAQVILFFTPWFSFNLRESGFYSGFKAIPLFVIPYVYIFYYLTREENSAIFKILMELALLWIPLALVKVFFTWSNAMNLSKFIGFQDSMRAARFPFWAVCALSIALIVLYQALLILESQNTRKRKHMTGG